MTIQQALDQKVWAVIGATHKTEKFGYKIYAIFNSLIDFINQWRRPHRYSRVFTITNRYTFTQ